MAADGLSSRNPRLVLSRLGLVCSLLAAAANTASAQQSVCAAGGSGVTIEGRQTGLSTSLRTYDFNGIESSLVGRPITSAAGLTFDGAWFGSPNDQIYSSFPNTFVDGAVYNYGYAQPSNPGFSTSLSVLFNTGTRGAAFNFAASAGRTIMTAWSRTTPSTFVERARIEVRLPAVSSESRACWWGFDFGEGSTFDKLTVESTPDAVSPLAFGIDNLQVAQPTTVPEPSSVALLAVGLAAIWYRRRK